LAADGKPELLFNNPYSFTDSFDSNPNKWGYNVMSFFTIPYQIHFEDTKAYGSNHYLTNLRFQCEVREAFYFGPGLDGKNRWRDDLSNLVMLTYEDYSRNLALVRLGDKLALMLTYGETSLSSLQLCVRIVQEDETPVRVGFQRIFWVNKDTKEFIVVSESLAQYYGVIDEPLMELFLRLLH
jgi:acyl-CoA thioesterase FadM